jgi:hypothetical protein
MIKAVDEQHPTEGGLNATTTRGKIIGSER